MQNNIKYFEQLIVLPVHAFKAKICSTCSLQLRHPPMNQHSMTVQFCKHAVYFEQLMPLNLILRMRYKVGMQHCCSTPRCI